MSDRDFCNHHPKQVLVGVCPLCLNDKLLVIAANQNQHKHQSQHRRHCSEEVAQPISHSRKPSHGGLLAFGSLLSRLELSRSHYHRGGSCGFDAGGSDTQSTSLSIEDVDSFISIKFEGNGVASWDKNKVSETSWDATIDHKGLYEEGKSYSNKRVGVHTKTSEGSLRWRKRIGHLLQLVRGKRLKKPNGGVYQLP